MYFLKQKFLIYIIFIFCNFSVFSDSGFKSKTLELTKNNIIKKETLSETKTSNISNSKPNNEKWRSVVGKNNIYFSYFKIIFSTIMVVTLILIIYFFMGKRSGFTNSSYIKILEIYPIDNTNKLIIAEILNRVVVIGSSSKGMNKILEFSDKDTLDKVNLKSSEKDSFNMNFSEKLASLGIKNTFKYKNKKYINKTLDKINKIGV